MTRALFGVTMILFAGAGHGAMSKDDLSLLGNDDNFGNVAWMHGDFSSAAAWYERAASLAPDSPEPPYNLALSYYRLRLYEQSLRYLDRAQPLARGPLRGKCLLLRGDIEFRSAMALKPARQVEGLERALILYREALAAGADPEIARYDIEVVKLRLPPARGQAPKVTSANSQQETSAGETAAGSAGPESKNRGKPKEEDRDW